MYTWIKFIDYLLIISKYVLNNQYDLIMKLINSRYVLILIEFVCDI